MPEEIRKKINDYFIEKLETFGTTPQGVDYNGPQAQEIRFEQLIKVIDSSRPFTVIDYGFLAPMNEFYRVLYG